MAVRRARARTQPDTASDNAASSEGLAAASLQVTHVPLASIEASGRNPRRKISHIDQLAESIQAYGLLQPVLVRPIGDRFELIAGYRRLEALRQLGHESVPVVVRMADVD